MRGCFIIIVQATSGEEKGMNMEQEKKTHVQWERVHEV